MMPGDVPRYEYTVIGDPVNEAARLTELARAVPGRLVASGRPSDLATAGHVHRRPCHVRRPVGGEERDHRGHLLGTTWTA